MARHSILPTGRSQKVFNKNIIDFQHGISVDGKNEKKPFIFPILPKIYYKYFAKAVNDVIFENNLIF